MCIYHIQRSDFETKSEVWRRIDILIDYNLLMGHISSEQAELLEQQLKCKLERGFECFEKLMNGEQEF